MTGVLEAQPDGIGRDGVEDDWLDGFAEIQALRDALRRRRAAGDLDLANLRELETLRRWSDALAGLEKEALERFVSETFVELGLMTGDDAEALLTGLRLFRRREWNALPPHVRAQLVRHEQMTQGIVDGFRRRLEKARAIVDAQDRHDLAAGLRETKSDRTALIEIRGALDFMNEVSAHDPLLRLRLKDAARGLAGGAEAIDKAIDERTIPAHRIATLISRAVRAILETIVKLETSNLKAHQPRLFESKKTRAVRAISGHLRRARELGCAAAVRSEIIRHLRSHPGIFEDYFGTPHPMR